MVSLYPIPQGETPSTDYKVTINGSPVQPYACRVSQIPFNTTWPGCQRPLDQTEMASFISFDMTGHGAPAYIQVDVPHEFHKVTVRPLSRGVRSSFEKNSISFTIFEPGQYTLELDGHHKVLHIFANSQKDYGILPTDENTLYFGAGVHRPGPIELQSNQTLYIASGAVVHTSIKAHNARNIRILGGGIIDNSEYHRTTYTCFGCPTCLELFDCENVEIGGVIFRDACAWTVTAYNCRNVLIENVKTIGMWRYNSDGFDMVNSRNILIKNCFLRNFDDCIVLKGFPPYDHANVENVLVSGCVVWCDWGRGLEIGAETCADEYRNIVFEDCDVIHSTHIAIDIQNSGYAHVHDLRFENIRVEYERDCQEPIYQKSLDMLYAPKKETFMPCLILAEVHAFYHDLLRPDMPNGHTSGVIYNNIQVLIEEGLPLPPIQFRGISEACDTRDILITNLTVNGARKYSLADANIEVGAFASDIHID